MGIIGKTQGVNKAAKPLKNAKKKIVISDLSVSLLVVSFLFSVTFATDCSSVESILSVSFKTKLISSLLLFSSLLQALIFTSKTSSKGGKHCISSQVWKV